MLIDILSVIAGLFALFFGGEWLVKSSSRFAKALGIPAIVIGLTVVSLGTSTPELVVSISAALAGNSEISFGNVVGSNIANIGLILGIAGMITPLTVKASVLRREIPFMVFVSLLLVVFCLDGEIGRAEGAILFIGYILFTVVIYRLSAGEDEDPDIVQEVEAIEGDPKTVDRRREIALIVGSILVLVVGAQLTVTGAVNIARSIGISELVIGLTLVAVGTSLPEIATSVIAALRKHHDIAIGNVVGSNIANILVILGLTSILRPIPVPETSLTSDLPAMIFFAVLIVPFILDRRLERFPAGLLLFVYFAFVIWTFL